MAAMYPVPCECGATLEVPGSAAGTKVPCRCGRAVEVPTLARLKASVGQTAVSADFELEQLLGAGALPLESNCVLCGRPTDNKATYTVICELTEEVIDGIPTWQWVAIFCLFLCFGFGIVLLALVLLFGRHRSTATRGRDLVMQLPIRVCEECMQSLTTSEAVRKAMCLTPVYDRLFAKYPAARIGNADC